VVASATDAKALQDLFVRRGFSVVVAPCTGALDSYLAQGAAPLVAILDLAHPEALETLGVLAVQDPRPVLVGIVGRNEVVAVQESLDAAFARPVDRARIFVRVVELVAERKKGRPSKRLTGVVGVVAGNDLFRQVARELQTAVPPVNAGAILEKALRDMGSDPFALGDDDLATLLANGRLADALTPFAEETAIEGAIRRIAILLMTRLG
jgi:hypothetical protein